MKIVLLPEAQRRFEAEDEWWRENRDAKDLFRSCRRRAAMSTTGTIMVADDKWMSVMRCNRCGALWAEDAISSGHATLLYIYPIATEDPIAWLAAAIPLDPPAS